MQAHAIVCAALLLAATAVSGQEQTVNVRTAGTQSNAVVAAGPAGFVVAWNSYYTSTGRSYDILARRFDPNGGPLDSEFQVNPSTEGNQSVPAIAMNATGDFVIAWQGIGVDQEDIYVRLYDPNGLPRSPTIPVNDLTAGRQLRPRVAMSGTGGLVVVWEDRTVDGNDDIYTVRGRWFDSQGLPKGPSLRLDDDANDARYPDIAMDGRGHCAVVWLRNRTSKVVLARLLDPNGVAPAGGFEVCTQSFSSLTAPSIAMNGQGHFVIAWDGDPNRASEDHIHIRCYDPNGRPRTEPIRLNPGSGAQQWPQVAMTDANDFVVAWQCETQDADAATDIFALRFDGTGQPIGQPLRLNACVAGNQRYPDVAMKPDGGFVAAWESEGQDGSGYAVMACIVK
jgi:hypothetical protein